MEKQLQHLQEKLQIMKMQETNNNKKFLLENQSLKKELEKNKDKFISQENKVEIMGESLSKMAQLSRELLNFSQPTKVYTLFLKEQWYKFQMDSLAQQIGFNIETPKEFVDIFQVNNEE
jgi:hypothetical protein